MINFRKHLEHNVQTLGSIKFVWIDETGSDTQSHARKYGYGYIQEEKGMSIISSTGLLASELTTSTVGTDNFYDFIRGTPIPQMMPSMEAILDPLLCGHLIKQELCYLPAVQILQCFASRLSQAMSLAAHLRLCGLL